ncbi:HET-domain-containing protein [Xylaria castorea]|nr:HET-domain-containing protein [Xylaria castorea]
MMSSSPDPGYYEPLPNATSIRVLILAPGKPDDADVYCWLLPSDLDWDHERFPSTAPRPVESLSFVVAKLAGGEERKFPIHVDMDFDYSGIEDNNPSGGRMHPFQRYEALSYVWGVQQQQQQHYIFLDGRARRFPVTRNLYEALRSLRLPHSDRRLWVDAVCINQGDHEEKKVQLGLLRRVYRQAEKVIAYLPLPPQDLKNINELVGKILKAGRLYREKEGAETGSSSSPGQQQQQQQRNGQEQFNSISDWDVVEVAWKESEPFSAALLENPLRDRRSSYLEDFGLPREDSPLWDSWRRMFASPYFRRIWILQEIALGRNLRFWFGSAGGDAELLFVAHGLLSRYSGAVNMGYTAPSGRYDSYGEDTRAVSRTVMVGSRNAARMFRERLSVRNDGSGDKLIDMLAMMTTFQATDARDKIYALLGLTCDGEFFAQHVSYAPWDSTEKIFIKFARLFVERDDGIEVLLQAGLRDEEDDEWPSWVPHWDNPSELSGQSEATQNPGDSSPCMRVDESSQALHISEVTVLGEIKLINDSVFEKLQVSPSGVSITPFVQSLVAGFRMIFKAASSSVDPEELFEPLFHVLAQPKPPHKKPMPQGSEVTTATLLEDDGEDGFGCGPSLSSPATPSQSTKQHNNNANQQEHDREYQALRTGFRELLNYFVALSKVRLSDSSEDAYKMLLANSPAEYYSFLRRAMDTTAHRRFCVTEGGHVGLGPKRTRAGDSVAVFEGSNVHFVLRRVTTHRPAEGDVGEEEKGKYRLVGPAYFYTPESEGKPSAAVGQDIMIV